MDTRINGSTDSKSNVRPNGRLRQSLLGSVGAFVEQFDFNLYGLFAVFLAKQFFPSTDPIVSLLQAFLVFGLSFFLRPLGGALLGAYVDRKGRKAGLLLTVLLMSLGSLILALAPSYSLIGAFAPILVVLARSLQGLAAGGEVGTAMPFLAEAAPARRRGLWSSSHGIATGLSLLFASAIAALLVSVLTPAQMSSWGWRVGFLISAALGLVALWIRRGLHETEAFVASAEAGTTRDPLVRLFRTEPRSVLRVICIAAAPLCFFYFWISYLPTFGEVFGHLPATQTRPWSTVALVLFTIVVPIAGLLSDRIGRRPALLGYVFACMALVPFSVLMLSGHPSIAAFAIIQCLGAVFVAIEMGIKTAVVSEQFGRSVRGAGVGLAYSVAAALFGGTASFIATWLTGTGNPAYLIGYLLLIGVVSLVAYLRMPETRGVDLTESDEKFEPAR